MSLISENNSTVKVGINPPSFELNNKDLSTREQTSGMKQFLKSEINKISIFLNINSLNRDNTFSLIKKSSGSSAEQEEECLQF